MKPVTKWLHAAALAASLLMPSSAVQSQGASTILDMAELLDDEKIGLKGLLLGAAMTLGTLDDIDRATGRTRLFCPPPGVNPTGDQAVELFRSFIQKEPEQASLPIEDFPSILILALQEAYPCQP